MHFDSFHCVCDDFQCIELSCDNKHNHNNRNTMTELSHFRQQKPQSSPAAVAAIATQHHSSSNNNNDNCYAKQLIDETNVEDVGTLTNAGHRPPHRRRRHLLQSTLSPIRMVKERINFAGGATGVGGSVPTSSSSSSSNQPRNQNIIEATARTDYQQHNNRAHIAINNLNKILDSSFVVPGTDQPSQPQQLLQHQQTTFQSQSSPFGTSSHHHHHQHQHAQCFHTFAPYSYFSDNSLQFMKTGNYYCKSPHSKVCRTEFIDVGQMEDTLYRLLTDFHMGKLHAFGDGVTFESMIKVREQQENLARLHFELNLQQSNKQSFENDFFNDSLGGTSIMSKLFSKSNMQKLIQNLQNLCKSIEKLQLKNSQESSDQFFN